MCCGVSVVRNLVKLLEGQMTVNIGEKLKGLNHAAAGLLHTEEGKANAFVHFLWCSWDNLD